jgi:hypothetical protein
MVSLRLWLSTMPENTTTPLFSSFRLFFRFLFGACPLFCCYLRHTAQAELWDSFSFPWTPNKSPCVHDCAPLKNEEMRGRRRIRNGKKKPLWNPAAITKAFFLIVADRHQHPSGFRHDQYTYKTRTSCNTLLFFSVSCRKMRMHSHDFGLEWHLVASVHITEFKTLKLL